MQTTARAGAAALLLIFCMGCGASRSAHQNQSSATFDRLTAADLAVVSARTLEAAITMLRPSFLQTNLRGEAPTVFVNGTMASSPNVLRDLMASEVAEVHYLRGFEATARYGSVHSGAVIEVTLRRR
ncbi:MAG TPA: hypothetical protein VGJ18_22280 [Gemmatimonadaceae bacterium]|jgi:hypothetical protein